MLNLFLALIWLGVAGVIFALPWINPQAPPWRIPGTDLSMGWFALALCFYNVVRWWTTRSSSKNRGPLRSVVYRRRFYDDEVPSDPHHDADIRYPEEPPSPQ
jgi:hypothetical protein